MKVVEHEGPIHVDEAMRRVIQHWGMNTLGSRIVPILKKVEKSCIQKKLIIKRGKFYWSKKEKDIKVRNRDVEGVNKKIKFIAPEEIGEAAKMALKIEYSMPLGALVNQTAKLLGFNRVTEDIYICTQKIMNNLIKKGEIVKEGDRLVLPHMKEMPFSE